MRRLVIHLGLPKTATTTLQMHIFRQLPGYLGRFYEEEAYSSAALFELDNLYYFGASIDNKQVFEIDGRPVWVPALEAWVEDVIASDEEILLWSQEGLTLWSSPAGDPALWPVMDSPTALPRRDSHPIVGFLQQLRELLPQDIELKTILTLRNQSDWLISLAAEVGVPNARFVEGLIRDNDAFLDYYAITKDLERLRGPENHLTLLFENPLEHNCQEIFKFAGYPPADFQNLTVPEDQANVRKSKRGWKVAGTGVDRLERRIEALRRSSPFLDKHLTSNQALRRIFRPLLGSKARRRVLGTTLAKGTKISLTQEQRTAIKSHCEASNARLSAHLNVDLKALGY